jgi:hypothetical protein
MIETVEAEDSGYRFMPGVSQYSCGIAALAGFTIERVRFANPVPLTTPVPPTCWQKQKWVLDEMEYRMGAFGGT